jgi:cyanophycin synthetase
VIGTAGDRRDSDMIEIGRVAAQYFDVLVVREDAKRRGREQGEVAALIEQGIREQQPRRVKEVHTIIDEFEATRYALSIANTGDVLAVMGEDMQGLADILMTAAR